jgi:hypothetical protein
VVVVVAVMMMVVVVVVVDDADACVRVAFTSEGAQFPRATSAAPAAWKG